MPGESKGFELAADRHTDSQAIVKDREAWHAVVDLATEQ